MATFDSFITPDEAAFDFGSFAVRRQVVIYSEKILGYAGSLDGGALRRELEFKLRLRPQADLCVIDWEHATRIMSPKAIAAVAGELRRAIQDGGFRGKVLCTGLLSEADKSRWWAFQEQLSSDTHSAMRARIEPFLPAIRAHDGIAYQLYVPYADTSGEGLARLRTWLHGSHDLATAAIGPDRLVLPLLCPRYPITTPPPARLRQLDTAVLKTIARWIASRGIDRVGLWDFAGEGYESPGLSIAGTVGMVAAAVREMAQHVKAANATLAPDFEAQPPKVVELKPTGVKAVITKSSGA